ncbi:MAG: PASTA domain-containing protein, partial [Muribaculaceae bacterium]|nr:PASTA domain-containing protein [Muribaculaceae bacterium]
CKAKWGTAILMDVETGDIKAISNLERSDKDSTYIESMNHAVARVEPGSVVKLVGMIIALEDGFAGNLERTIVTERGGYRYHGGRPIRDTHFAPSGALPIYRLLQYSSNIGMTKLVATHFEHDPDAYRRRVEQLGLFDRFNTGMASEYPAFYPRLKKGTGGCIELSRMIYGYSTQIAPLYTCALYNAIANDGRFVRPRLVKGLRFGDGVDSTIPVSYVRDRICSPENARILRSMLRRVVTEKGGTAYGLKRDPEIVEIAGKTGTALISKERPRWTHEDSVAGRVTPFVPGYLDGHYRLAFVGFFPYDKPKYTCMVLIADPKPGIRSAQYTSGATVRAIAEKLHSRGLLDNNSDYLEYIPEDRRKSPEFYATTKDDRIDRLGKDFGFRGYSNFSKPAKVRAGVPDVIGLGVREAVKLLEEAGYPAAVKGTGYVSAQNPPPAAAVSRGTVVNLVLSE